MDNSPSQDSSAPVETSPSVETQATPSAPAEGSAPEAQGTEAPAPSYTPNWKYKAAGQEFELDEEYRPYVKSPEDEKRIKRLFEQAKAFEPVRADKEKFRTKAEQYEAELQKFYGTVEQVNGYRKKQDVRKALQSLGFTKQEILKAAKQELDFDDLPQQAQDIYHQHQEAERQSQFLAEQNNAYANQMAALMTSVKKTELSQALANPDIKEIAAKFDAVNGEGAFYGEVVHTGKTHFVLNQQDLSAAEAIEAVVRKIRPFMTQQAPAQEMQQPQAPRQVPVIPSAKGAAQAAAQKGVQSLDDLKRIRVEKYGY